MKLFTVLPTLAGMALCAPAFAQNAANAALDCTAPQNAELEQCLELGKAGTVTNFVPIAAGAAGAGVLAAVLGGGGSTSGTTGTTATTGTN